MVGQAGEKDRGIDVTEYGRLMCQFKSLPVEACRKNSAGQLAASKDLASIGPCPDFYPHGRLLFYHHRSRNRNIVSTSSRRTGIRLLLMVEKDRFCMMQ